MINAVIGQVGNGTGSETPTKYQPQVVDSARREQRVVWVPKTSDFGRWSDEEESRHARSSTDPLTLPIVLGRRFGNSRQT